MNRGEKMNNNPFWNGDPYSIPQSEKERSMKEELLRLSALHRQGCPPYRRLCGALREDTPLLPVSAFRDHALFSVPEDSIIRELTSSGTSGQAPSRIYLDESAAEAQQKVLLRIMQDFLGKDRLPMLIIDAKKTVSHSADFSARRAGIAGFAFLSSSRTWALDEHMQPDLDAICRFAEEYKDKKVLIFGFTYMIRQYFSLPLLSQRIRPDLSNAILIHGGGWKTMTELSVSPERFREELRQAAGIRRIHNYYGMTEQLGSIFMECECGHLHASRWSDIQILDPLDHSECAAGKQGVVSLSSVLPSSYPGHRILTEDLGRILGTDDCPCGRKGKYFAIDGRVPRTEIRGCSDTFASGRAGSGQSSAADDSSVIEYIPANSNDPAYPETAEIFCEPVLSCLQALSENLLHDPARRAYPEAVSFGFWLRRAHLEQLRSRYPEARKGIGRVFISAPSNMPALFAYNWAVALLAGCSCTIRISNRTHPVTEYLCHKIQACLSRPEFKLIQHRTSIISFPRSGELVRQFSETADVRIFWGSDSVVRRLSRIPAKPGCRDLLFPDRYSISILSARAVNALPEEELRLLCDRFYRDTFEADQNACSSPRIVFWIADLTAKEAPGEDPAPGSGRILPSACADTARARKKWWTMLASIVRERYRPDTGALLQKYSLLVRQAMDIDGLSVRSFADNLLIAAEIPADFFKYHAFSISSPGPSDLSGGSGPSKRSTDLQVREQLEARCGLFFESVLPGLQSLPDDLGGRLQTVTIYGPGPALVKQALQRRRSYPALRITEVGEALSFDPVWDGKDLIRQLSGPSDCFFEQNDYYAARPMLITDHGETLTYSQVWDLQELLLAGLPARSLLFILCRNDVIPIAAYAGCLRKGHVPLLLPADLSPERLDALVRRYHPSHILAPPEQPETQNWSLRETGFAPPPMHPDLALLLSTSGSTGSPKLVRLSRRNLQSNAASIAAYLGITENDRAVTSLPMEYTYGLSVINSHMLCGAALLVTDRGIMDFDFWDFIKQKNATSFAGVPHSYTLMKRIGFFDMELPSLTVLTQAGGRLPADLQEEYACWAAEQGKQFFVMYGQTEATARMSYLPPDMFREKTGSIGIPIPGGSFSFLCDDPGDETSRELIYRGPNVSLGYAGTIEDLQKGDENHGILHTGDLGKIDEDGFYYITGRKSRFVKISGKRISLDELEKLLTGHFPGNTFLCAGDDETITIGMVPARGFSSREPILLQPAAGLPDEIVAFLSRQTGIRSRVFRVRILNTVPRTTSGKINYNSLLS